MIYLLSFVKKIVNKLFGKTRIFVIVLGWFLIITGILMLSKPVKAKKSLAGQGFGIIKGYLLLLALFLGSLLVSLANKINGLLALIILIAGIAVLVKAYFLFKKKASLKINKLVEKVSIKQLKIYAMIQIFIGILMLILHRRIWY